ncbi:tyrosine-type recombinase/integrase [Desulfolucanica intricata]|uniref:tyrosine-type recombinase/integrase n=1 Tax=Desulfolucanica intricata TaxID=1285191 RepID=UPI00082A5DFF|nr:tyrosine-type recombinase/integrase [Desulfolucanica intricata]
MAKRKRRTVLEFDENTSQPVRPGGDNWELCVKAFNDGMTLRNLSYYTKKHYMGNLNTIYRLLKELKFPTAPTKLTIDNFRQLVIDMLENQQLNPVTVNHRIKALQLFFKFLLEEGYITNNPVENLKKVKASRTIIEAFTEDQIRELLAQPNKKTFVGFRDYCIMLLLLDTGLRLKELLNIRVEDVDLAQRKIKVMGKGSKERYVYFNTTTKEALSRFITIRGDSLHHSFLWITREDEPLNRNTLQERIRLYGREAGIKNVRVSPHTFRHTFAKLFILNGGNTLALQQLLGHSTLDMVRVYVNLWGTDLQAMHRKFSPVDKLIK